MSALGIILAGGRATRLGPLAAQLNKSLVTVGQKPMLVHQVQQLRRAGCFDVHVVVSPGSKQQVANVIERAGLRNVNLRVQEEPLGPAHALEKGLDARPDSVMVLLADTLIGDEDLPSQGEICVAEAPETRGWCGYYSGTWEDKVWAKHYPWVSVGAYHFNTGAQALMACYRVGRQIDGMANFLNEYEALAGPLRHKTVKTWHDVGDVKALARTNREHFISRSFNQIELDERGILTKFGYGKDFAAEAKMMMDPPEKARHLFPRVFSSDGHLSTPSDPGWYKMEHVDLPSLAELWLYWPAVPAMWEHAVSSLVEQLHDNLWTATHYVVGNDVVDRARIMYHDKLMARYATDAPSEHFIKAWSDEPEVMVNGLRCPAGKDLIETVADDLGGAFAEDAESWQGIVHGDPNFTNVLWSMRTGSFKLLDPRGNWGGDGPRGDIRYDMGKIAYSPTFAAITHGLFKISQAENPRSWGLTILPQREAEHEAIVRALTPGIDERDLQRLKIYMLLSSAPLHEEPESSALYLAACRHAREVYG